MSGGGWTLAARFSNADSKNWMRDDAYWWYDIQSSQGSPTSPSSNYDMISEAFWKVKGDNIKITRSDDGSHSALLRTYSNCLSDRTLRGPVMEGLLIVTSGLMTNVLQAVQCILVVGIVPRQGLAKRTVVATSREAIALGSGVSGTPVMVR